MKQIDPDDRRKRPNPRHLPSAAFAAWTLVVASLSGCAALAPRPAPAPRPPSAAKVIVAAPVQAAPNQTERRPEPVAPAASAQATALPIVVAEAAPYGAAVAARFPDPTVRYRTPAFEPRHEGFTSNPEMQAWMHDLVQDAVEPTTLRLLPLGFSQRGVPIEALLFSRLADTHPQSLSSAGRPTLLLVGQQHGDEPAGSEALMVIAQQLATGALAPLLDRINVIVLPRANPDGAQAGSRATASGIDLNRDHLLLKTPEAQAQAQLAREYQPAVVVDAHEYVVDGGFLEKFGAIRRHDALLQYATVANLPEFVARASDEWFRRPLLDRLKAAGLSVEWYHTTSTDPADRKVSMGGVRPDTGRNVNGLRNAISLLVETRGVGLGRLHFARRVHTQVVAITSVLDSTAKRSADLVKLRRFVDNEVSAKACQGDMLVEADTTPSEYPLIMIDPVSGADKRLTVAWDSALALQALKVRARPCGYWLGADQADAVRRLRGLGVQVQRIEATGVLRAETYRELARTTGVRADTRGSIDDGGGVSKVQVETVSALIDVPPGSWYVGLDQPLANLVLAALEPDTQTSYVANRIVDNVASVARVMLRPTLNLSVLP